jgi:hypothetical protein
MHKKFVSLKETRPAPEPTNVHWRLSRWGKRADCVGDHSPPLSAEVKDEWSYTSTHPSVIMLWYLTNHKDSNTLQWKMYAEGVSTNYTHTRHLNLQVSLAEKPNTYLTYLTTLSVAQTTQYATTGWSVSTEFKTTWWPIGGTNTSITCREWAKQYTAQSGLPRFEPRTCR